MIPKECKRLAEVDFPVAAVSKFSIAESKIRHRHPKALHLWWARRPLAACRSMLMALLLPDPCDPHCPRDFKAGVASILPRIQGSVGAGDLGLRNALLRFIGDFSNWDNSSNPTYIEAARGLISAAQGENIPLVVDPFAGGGSIPLEALRIGCDAFASDLNPVACLILKTLLEDIPRHGPQLAEDLRRAGAEIGTLVAVQLSELYPPDQSGAVPIAYRWARTITCGACGAEIPLVRSFWLSTKPKRQKALRYLVDERQRKFRFEIFEPDSESQVQPGNVARAKATCLVCENVMSADRVRMQLTAQNGGSDSIFGVQGERIGGACLLAVVTTEDGRTGRNYRIATERDYLPVAKSLELLRQFAGASETVIARVPDDPIPRTELRRISLPIYGMDKFSQLFTSRQLLALSTVANAIRIEGSFREAPAINRLLAMSLDKAVDLNNALVPWKPDAECPVHVLARHDIPMAWDFVEAALLSGASGSFQSAYERTADSVAPSFPGCPVPATTLRADACGEILPDESASVWFTDPPYYDSVPYGHLSDFFLIWARRSLRDGGDLPALSPKIEECVVDRPHKMVPGAKTATHFEQRIAKAMAKGAKVVKRDGIGAIVFAHKTTEGWEALLSGVISAGWVVTASWPISTEMQTRLNARENASLGTSVHLVCRPRSPAADVGDWSDVARELPSRVGDWIERLQSEGIRGADLVFACIGPAMEIYSRYRRVEDAEGREIPLGGDPEANEPYKRGFLAYVWETVGRLALEQVLGTAEAKARNGAAGALEEDSRLTALFLWTLQATDTDSAPAPGGEADVDDEGTDDDEPGPKKKQGFTLVYDVARRFAQPLGIHLDKWEGRIIETDKGVVRLIPVVERSRQLFGEADAAAVAHRIEHDVKANLNYTFAFMQEAVERRPEIKVRRGRAKKAAPEAPTAQAVTTLDRVHAAMLLQASGQSNGLRALLKDEIQRGPDFLRLANALSALYPKDSDEKRLLDAMLLAVPR